MPSPFFISAPLSAVVPAQRAIALSFLGIRKVLLVCMMASAVAGMRFVAKLKTSPLNAQLASSK